MKYLKSLIEVFEVFNWITWSIQLKYLKSCSNSVLLRLGVLVVCWPGEWTLKVENKTISASWSWVELSWGWAWQKCTELLVESLTLRYDPMGNSPRCSECYIPILLYIQWKLCPTSQNQKKNSFFFENGREIEFLKNFGIFSEM